MFRDNSEEDEPGPMVENWDIFLEEPPEATSGSAEGGNLTKWALRLSKLLTSIVVFILVLGGGVVAKGSALFITSQLRPEPRVIYCPQNKFIGPSDAEYIALLPEVERICWVWILLFTLLTPEIGALLRSARILVFKPTSWSLPSLEDLAVVLAAETCSSVGTAILAFSVLPDLDVLKGVMITNCVCMVPAILGLLEDVFPEKPEKQEEDGIDGEVELRHSTVGSIGNKKQQQTKHSETWRLVRIIAGVSAIVFQVTGIFVWPLVEMETPALWITPAAILLTSFGWWQNYVSKDSPLAFIKFLSEIKARQKRARYPTYLVTSLWKMICLFVSMLVIWAARGESVPDLFNKLHFGNHNVTIVQNVISTITSSSTDQIVRDTQIVIIDTSEQSAPWLLLIQVVAAYVAYISGKYACRIMLQGFSYATPVTLTVPVTLSLLVIFCAVRNNDPCAFEGAIPPSRYMFFRGPPNEFLDHFLGVQHAWIWLLWFASQVWVTQHIWWPKCQRLASTELIFVTPWYNGLLIDQSLALNRRRDDDPPQARNITQTGDKVSRDSEGGTWCDSEDAVPRVIACATLWHETREEMVEMLKSIFRMDEDQSARSFARDYFSDSFRRNKDFYHFETHIFFDDAFVGHVPAKPDSGLVNSHVRDLLRTVNLAASHVHETNIQLDPPCVITTPYGGQLVWTLPGKTKLIVHLKDSAKIRHKKRWSQVMYMYYLLGYRLLELPVSPIRKDVIAENTYLLALDGDIDFQPDAVRMLVDLMKRDRNLGAACGRIHPIGSGAMQWYQRFEYAIGHWLQKATEHMIGCVLCSPGCFSLFRGSALMDVNVMRKYTTQSEEARHYVQYDQGEDRWLCTLLLQRGYRVEYSAASDAYTHCPEGFGEFFNQRRRWVPSTMANIVDLLADYKRTVRANDNISMLYIAYQTFLLAGSVLGPGTILLMLMGAFVTVFHMSDWASLIVNVVPIIFFMVICYYAKSDTQIMIAMIMSVVYALVMIAVLIGILVQISDDGALAPSSLFFFIVAGQFIITALLHPLEFGCLPYGVIYYITIPSMYMLLIIYSLFNLNDVSWGTRDDPKPEETQQAQQPEVKEEKAEGIKGFLDGIRSRVAAYSSDEEGSFEFSFVGLFKCMFCTHHKVVDEKLQIVRIADTLEALNQKLEQIDKNQASLNNTRRRSMLGRRGSPGLGLGALVEETESPDSSSSDEEFHNNSTASVASHEQDVVSKTSETYWIEADTEMNKFETHFIPEHEKLFWDGLITKYLKPLKKNKAKEKIVAAELKSLRDKTVFGFFLLNAIFVLTLFLVQMNRDITFLNIPWPLTDGSRSTFTYFPETQEISLRTQQLKLEPIGLLFLFSFAFIMVIQFIAMVFHRFGTFSHILASTKINWYCTNKVENMSGEAYLKEHAVEIARELQRLKEVEDEVNKPSPDLQNIDLVRVAKGVQKRPTIADMQRKSRLQNKRVSLADAFERRFLAEPRGSIDDQKTEDNNEVPVALRRITRRRDTLQALQHRRSSALADRRISASILNRSESSLQPSTPNTPLSNSVAFNFRET